MASIQMDPGKSVRIATACTECQRRKQKCSREWPCNHCQARRIAHLCKFVPKKALARSGGNAPAPAATAASTAATTAASVDNDTRLVGNRVGNGTSGNAVHVPQRSQAGSSISVFPGNDDIRVIGYLPDEHEPALGNTAFESSAAITLTPHDTVSPEMESALRAIPPKPYTDLLVQHFLGDTNYHYYALYPPSFSHDYSVWWSNRTKTKILSPEFTCLLLRVCACAALYLDVKIQEKLESELGENVQTLTERYHHAAQRLSSTIPPGKGGLAQVQQIFLTSFWYKTEGLFIEAWHSLSSAIHQGQELGLYKRSFRVEMSEFEKEMRRRVWCLLYSWDWQMSLMLARPFIINTQYYGFELPNLRLESPDMPEGLPSPVAHIALQCQLGQEMSKIPGVMGGSLLPEQADSIQHELAKWMASFPPVLQLKDPDTQYDTDYHYVVFQRYQLNCIGQMLSFVPVKLSLAKPVDSTTTAADMEMRKKAIDCSFPLLDVARQMLDYLLPYNAKFYLAIFLIFDTTAYLCSAVAHDHTHTLYQREKVIDAIVSSLTILENVRNTKLGATCHAVIRKILSSLPSDVHETISQCSSSSPECSAGGPKTPSDGHHHNFHDPTMSPDNLDLNLNAPFTMSDDISGMSVPTSLELPTSGTLPPELAGIETLSNADLGGLSQIWDWGYLGLGP